MRMNIAKLCLTLFFSLALSSGTIYAQDLNSRAGDEKALMDLYNSTNGNNWYDRTGWSRGAVSLGNQMAGVTVGTIDGELRVTAIDMQKVTINSDNETLGNNLTGTLPESIGNLKKVTYFNVKQNKLSGKIPATIGNMENLEWLSLAGQRCDIEIGKPNVYNHRGCAASGKKFEETNSFEGNLPENIGSLLNLKVLEIRRQFLTGAIPSSIGNLTKLKALFLNHQRGANSLGGELPKELGNLVQLQNIDLKNGTNTSTSDDPTIDYGTGFTGEVPVEFQQGLTSNERSVVGLNNNNLTGNIPEFLNLKDIRLLGLSGNNFTGGFPIRYFNQGNNSAIWLFDISDNNLDGEIPDGMIPPTYPGEKSNYHNISVFRIGGNNFTGSVPDWVQEVRGHVQVNIIGQSFSGPFPKKLAEQNKVRLFWINENNFSGTLPDVNWGDDDLYSIIMSGNDFEGPIPESWESIRTSYQDDQGYYTGRFWRFEAEQMDLSGPIPNWLAEVPTLERIKLKNNRFTFKDILPNYDAIWENVQNAAENGRGSGSFELFPQKPFGRSFERTMPAGETLVLDLSEFDYEGNEYRWTKNGTSINGANSPILSISNVSPVDEGEYVLEVSNPALPELGTHSSEPITFQIGADDGGNNGDGDEGNSDDGDNDNVMRGDEQVLMDVYNSTNGDNWYDRTGWSSHSMSLEDEIAGVTVAMRDGELRVTAIDMQKVTTNSNNETLGNNLTGTLPSSLGNLTYVEKLNVKQNRLSGKLPPEIGNMTRLKRLSLAGQQCELDLEDTAELYFANQTGPCNSAGDRSRFEETNEFSGPLPGEWGNLESIELIEVRRQYLTGSLPESWGNLSTLRGLFIGNSKGSGPDIIGGEIPDSWGGMVSMQWFNLTNYHGNARFTGSFPQSAQGNWSNLNHINITTNEFEGPVPEFPNPTNINYTNFRNNNFTGGFSRSYSKTGQMTESVEQASNEQPLNTELKQNYPNPFNPATQIEFALTDAQKVRIEVYNIAGRRVATLVDDVMPAGNHSATFDAGNLASGVYLYRFISNTHRFTKKMTVIK